MKNRFYVLKATDVYGKKWYFGGDESPVTERKLAVSAHCASEAHYTRMRAIKKCPGLDWKFVPVVVCPK